MYLTKEAGNGPYKKVLYPKCTWMYLTADSSFSPWLDFSSTTCDVSSTTAAAFVRSILNSDSAIVSASTVSELFGEIFSNVELALDSFRSSSWATFWNIGYVNVVVIGKYISIKKIMHLHLLHVLTLKLSQSIWVQCTSFTFVIDCLHSIYCHHFQLIY